MRKCFWIGVYLTLLAGFSAHARTFTWNNNGVDFNTPANWNPATAGGPVATDTVSFTASPLKGYQVDWSASISNANAQFTGKGLVVTQNIGVGRTWTVSTNVNVAYSVTYTTASDTATVVHTSGQLAVPNGDIIVGNNGVGTLKIVNGTVATRSAYIGLGSTSQRGTLLVEGGGSLLTISAGIFFGYRGANHTLKVSNGATVYCGSLNVGGNMSVSNSQALITDPGTLLRSSGTITVGTSPSTANSLTVSNGAQVIVFGADPAVGATGTVMSVTDGATLIIDANGSQRVLTVKGSRSTMIVERGGAVISANSGAGSYRLRVNVGAAGNNSNTLQIATGGVLDASYLVTDGIGNLITNQGGVYQFAFTPPWITSGSGAGSVALTDGTIAFHNCTNVNVKGNWGLGTGVEITNMTFAGANTFRLDNATNNTESVAQDYTFDTERGPTNYVRLEMINGGTRFANGGVTVGAGGSVLFSNTVAAVDGAFTNAGVLTVVDSAVNFGGACSLNENFVLNWATNAWSSNTVTVAGPLTLPVQGAINVSATITNSGSDVVLFTAGGGISGSAKSWTVSVPRCWAAVRGSAVVLTTSSPNKGTLIMYR